MNRCFELALKGAGTVAPNPMVGAVLVYNDTIIGEGFHAAYGKAHAEVNCINSVPADKKQYISKSSLYVSLEPCAHFGKTPPCADLIIANKIPLVIIGCSDPFAAVAGKGIAKLKAAGVEVITGVLEKEAEDLNKRFFTFHEQQRPYIILKWAQSKDKKIGRHNSERIFISNEITNRLVHKWRSEEAAVLVGTNTAAKDNPALTTRLVSGNNPVRLVIDKNLKLPPSLQLFDGSVTTIVFNFKKQEDKGKLFFIKLDETKKIIPQVLHTLYNQQLQSLIVEGGAALLQSFIDEGIWDEARVITNTEMIIDEGVQAPLLQQHQKIKEEILGTDTITYFTHSKQ